MSFPFLSFSCEDRFAKDVYNGIYLHGFDEVQTTTGHLDVCFCIAATHEYLSRADDEVDFSKTFSHLLRIIPASMDMDEPGNLSLFGREHEIWCSLGP